MIHNADWYIITHTDYTLHHCHMEMMHFITITKFFSHFSHAQLVQSSESSFYQCVLLRISILSEYFLSNVPCVINIVDSCREHLSYYPQPQVTGSYSNKLGE